MGCCGEYMHKEPMSMYEYDVMIINESNQMIFKWFKFWKLKALSHNHSYLELASNLDKYVARFGDKLMFIIRASANGLM